MRSTFGYGLGLACAAAGGLLCASSAQAINVNLTGVDGFGTSSFNTAGLWDNAAAPSAGNDYFVGDGTRLRTPPDGSSYTFAGDSLTINNTTPYGDGFMYKGTSNTGVVTVDNLILDGGLVSHANGTGDVFKLDGAINVASASRIFSKQGHTEIYSDISGSGDLDIQATDDNSNANERIVTLFGDNSAYSGNINVSGKLTLGDTGIMGFVIGASGVNNGVSGTGVSVYDGTFSFDLTGASATVGDSWVITSVNTQTFGATFGVDGFVESGDVWSDGTYSFDEATGVLSVVPEPATLALMGLGGLAMCRRR